MSSRKRPLEEVLQSAWTPNIRNPATPFAVYSRQSLSSKRPRSAQSVPRSSGVRPGSARGILRRLAKLTAPTTKRRIVTPTSVSHGKENLPPTESDDDGEDLKRPKFALDVDESVEEENSGLLVPPTPSALLDESDEEDDEPPTITFLKDQERFEDDRDSRVDAEISQLPQSDPEIRHDNDGFSDEDVYSTFLTERGRRAISEEPTRMSRYSFGSIRMSDFGSELEVRRESDRQKRLAELEVQYNENYDGIDGEDIVHLGGETEDLRKLQRSPSAASDHVEETLHTPAVDYDTFQLDIQDGSDLIEHNDAVAHQRLGPWREPAPGDAPGEVSNDRDSHHNQTVEEIVPPPAKQNRRRTLLESVVAASRPRSRKKLKMNRQGNMVPSLPSSLIKRIVNDAQEKAGKRKLVLGKDHMKALEQATEWFFEQVSEDLATFASHGRRRKRIVADDVFLLMKRQRVLREHGDLRRLTKEWLPREVLKDLELPDRL